MCYSLFSSETNFTEVLFGKPEHELITERMSFSNNSSSCETDSTSKYNEEDQEKNAMIRAKLEDLLEVIFPQTVRVPVDLPEMGDQSPPLCTRMPPPGFSNLLHPSLVATMEEMVEENEEILPPSFVWSSEDRSTVFPPKSQFRAYQLNEIPIPHPLLPIPVHPNQFAMPFLPPPHQIPFGFSVPFGLQPPPAQAPFEVPPPLDLMSIPPISFWPVPEENHS